MLSPDMRSCRDGVAIRQYERCQFDSDLQHEKKNDMNEKEEAFEIRGFHGFTIVRDPEGFRDVRYKGESIQGVIDAKVRAFNQEEDNAILVLEIIEER